MLKSHRGADFYFLRKVISWIQDNMHPDEVPLACGIKISPHHTHTSPYLEIGMVLLQLA